MPATTFAALVQELLRADGSRPLVTFYDDATGERVELSVVTYANWVSKTAALVQDELGLARGDRVHLDLPTHWLTPVWLGAAWTVGLEVVASGGGADLVVCGPDGVASYAGSAEHVVALSLRPMGVRFDTPLPDGVVDYGVVVWGQPDAFLALDPPGPDDVAWRGVTTLTQRAVAAGGPDAPTGRVLTDLSPATDAGLPLLLGPLTTGDGTVWVANPDPDGRVHRARVEHATLCIWADGA